MLKDNKFAAGRVEVFDLCLLAEAFINNLQINDGEFGGIGLDVKRPFGNSDAEGDILEIIEVEMLGDDGEGPCWSSEQREYAYYLYHQKLIPYLKESLTHG